MNTPEANPASGTLARAARRLAEIEIWPLALMVAASMVSTRLLLPALGVAAAFWIVRWVANGRPSLRTPADGAILLLVLMLPVTLWATALPDTTLPQVYRLLLGIGLYYAIANWASTPGRLRWILFGAALAGLGLVLMAPFSVTWSIGKLPFIPTWLYERFTLLVSDTVHPNVLAGSLAILLPCALAILLFGWRQIRWPARLLVGVSFLGMAATLVLTQSRGAWIAIAVALGLMLVLRWRWGWIGLALAGIGGGVAVYLIGLTPILETLASSSTLGGLDGRIEVWSRAIYMIQDFPFTGVGMGSFGKVADLLYPFFLFEPGSIPHAHNLFLQVAVDLGIPGLIAWLAIFLLVALASLQVYRHGKAAGNLWAAGLGAALLCSQVALAVHGITDAVTWGMVRPAPIVWALWGLAVAALRVYTLPSAAQGVASGLSRQEDRTLQAEAELEADQV